MGPRIAGVRTVGSAFTVSAVRVSVLLPRDLGPVPDQETGPAGEFVIGLRDNLDDQFLGNELTAWDVEPVQPVGLIELQNDGARVRSIRRLQSLKGIVLGFFDVSAQFVVISCHS
jgi:hypothetical protein